MESLPIYKYLKQKWSALILKYPKEAKKWKITALLKICYCIRVCARSSETYVDKSILRCKYFSIAQKNTTQTKSTLIYIHIRFMYIIKKIKIKLKLLNYKIRESFRKVVISNRKLNCYSVSTMVSCMYL